MDKAKNEELNIITKRLQVGDQIVLDKYVDELITGCPDPINKLSRASNISATELSLFISQTINQLYIKRRVDYYLNCTTIDKMQLLQRIRGIAYTGLGDILDLKNSTEDHLKFRKLDTLSRAELSAIKKISYSKYGQMEIELHDPKPALKLLADIQGINYNDQPDEIKDEKDKKPRLFDLQTANSIRNIDEPEELEAVVRPLLDISAAQQQKAKSILNTTDETRILLVVDKDKISEELTKLEEKDYYGTD